MKTGKDASDGSFFDVAANLEEIFRDKTQTALLRFVSQNMGYGVAVLDEHFRMIYWNKHVVEFFGFPENFLKVGIDAKIVLRYLAEAGAYGDVDVEEAIEQRYVALSSGNSIQKDVYVNGRPLNITNQPTKSGYTIITYSDISERQRTFDELAEAKLAAEEANIAKSEFLANMSHELRTPLNAIIGFSDALSCGALGVDLPEPARPYMDQITQAGKHLFELLGDILDMSAIESAHFKFDEAPADLSNVVADCLSMLEHLITEHQTNIVFKKPKKPPIFNVDERRIRQIILNIMSNAIKYSPHGTCVTTTIQHDADVVSIIISDNGIGMDEREINIAMTPFGRVDSSHSSKKGGGTGLGLPLSKRIARSHGGDLLVESSPGKGTTVSLILPMSRNAQSGMKPLS